MRKYLTLYNVVKRGHSVLYVARPDRVPESVVSLSILKRFVKALNLKLYLLVPRNVESVFKEFEGVAESIIKYELLLKPLTWLELVKCLDMLSVEMCRKLGCQVALTPLFRDEMTLFAVLGLLEAAPHIFSEALPVKRGNGISLARPFYYVFSSDIVALAYLNGAYLDYESPVRLSEQECVVVKHVYGILWRSRELMYSSRKSVELLQNVVLANKATCRYCLAKTSMDPCPICGSLLAKSQQGLYRTSD